ncbi:uncharacterized protein LOC114355040 [Ostrinia furnacalis]|uniref:uncharacterized protein LOC114355040 n=1 Tax=Ostrinia furnacalis TaxID=93504 RepID=UPI00103D8545|nr:uncharacterized protein LOC114355040 [Ostrinia furnacalis]
MPLFNDQPVDVANEVFLRSNLTQRSPPSVGKRTRSEALSPTNVSPSSCKRVQLSDSPGLDDNSTAPDQTQYDLVNEAASYLTKINVVINSLGSRIDVKNRSTVMDMTQRVTAIVSLLALKSSSTETKLAIAQRDLLEAKINKNCSQNNVIGNVSKPTYAESLKLKMPKVAPAAAAMETRTPLPCVVAYPTSERSAEFGSSSATKQALMKAINPTDDGFQIVGLKKTANAGVVLRVTNENQIKKLQSVAGIKSAGLRLEKPKGRRPRILVKDVPATLEDAAFMSALYRQNIKDEMSISEDNFIKSTKIVRRRVLNNGRKWIGLELEPEIRKHLINTKEKIFIDWATCRFNDDVEIVRCMKCQQYGHVAKFCTEKSSCCGYCAEAHDTKDCIKNTAKDFKPVCAACKRFKKPNDHLSGSPDCPSYKAKLEQLILNTVYG